MNPLERRLVWLGYEEFTPLPQFAIEVAGEPGDDPANGPLAFARRILGELLERGWVELYRSDPWLDGPVTLIPVEDRQRYLGDDSCWHWREDDEEDLSMVWYGTTDEGYDAYTAG
ncbi:hypothetical protein [Actinoplanes couchii]|uniref:Uncharacterized protein n=1 Tax=Actinoplanes couchii TaxID=403638 RepID=A0ABQ3XGR9_9ACTN|nr:hypothetical protein [Actinoplanes couchii]MDR6320836.1 hypothetical protein [Actinoplanes couchii]GID57679.1 hypothetical protein Aco03nite_060830 [Actinoplanes couchii]